MSKAQWAEILIATRRFWSHLRGLRHVAWKKTPLKIIHARDGSSTQKESSSNWHDHHRAWKNVLLPVVFHANSRTYTYFPDQLFRRLRDMVTDYCQNRCGQAVGSTCWQVTGVNFFCIFCFEAFPEDFHV